MTLSRTGILRNTSFDKQRKPMKRSQARMKTSRPAMTPIRKAARGQDCTLRFPGCNCDPSTTVLCHSNRIEDGKGMGIKAPDTAAAFGCSNCHDMLDGRKPRPNWFTHESMQIHFDFAVANTHAVLKRMGLL